MADDIVTRLRGIGFVICYWCQEYVCEGNDENCCSTYDDRDNCHDRDEIITFAADEIERLRKELALQGCDCDECIYGGRK